jgi:hypothetical protein
MAKRTFLADIDLALNQILQARLENLALDPTGTGMVEGRVYYNTAIKKAKYYGYNKAGALAWLVINDSTHDHTGGDNGAVIDHVNLSNKGANTHVQIDAFITNAPTTFAPIAKGVTNGDAHDHLGGDGGTIAHSSLSGVGTNAHVVIDTHIDSSPQLHRQIDDNATAGIPAQTKLFSADKVLSLIAAVNSTVSGALLYKGGYDAAANTPLLDATPIAGIKQGWTYVVTVGGTFFTTVVAPGDMMIAVIDTPTLATHWTIVNKDIPDIVAATESVQGIIQLATQSEVQGGTENTKALTALKLRQALGTTATNQDAYKDVANGLSSPRKFSKQFGDGAALTYAITHGLGSVSNIVQVNRVATPFDQIECEVVDTSINVVTLNFNVAPTANQFNVTIIG